MAHTKTQWPDMRLPIVAWGAEDYLLIPEGTDYIRWNFNEAIWEQLPSNRRTVYTTEKILGSHSRIFKNQYRMMTRILTDDDDYPVIEVAIDEVHIFKKVDLDLYFPFK